MGSDNSSDIGAPSLSKLASLSTAVVLTVIWCFVFLLVFIICLLLWKTQQNKVTNDDVSLNEVTNCLYEVNEKTRIRENHKSYKERVNSVYYEWLVDHSPQRKPINSELNEMIEMS